MSEFVKNTLSFLLKQVLPFVLLFVVVSIVVDQVRQPEQLQQVNLSKPVSSMNGQSILFAQSEKPTLVYFWGTWCPVCQHTSPQVQKFDNNSAFNVVSVAMDSGANNKIATYLKKHQLSYTTINDADSVMANEWGVQVVPTIVVVDNGKVLQTFTGFNSYPMMRFKLWLAQLF